MAPIDPHVGHAWNSPDHPLNPEGEDLVAPDVDHVGAPANKEGTISDDLDEVAGTLPFLSRGGLPLGGDLHHVRRSNHKLPILEPQLRAVWGWLAKESCGEPSAHVGH